MDYRLEAFDPDHAATVLSWAGSTEEREAWASIVGASPDPSIFERWHAEAGVHPFELWVDGALVGYGEVWEDPDEGEAELARIIVNPRRRGRGLGRRLATLLVERARALGYGQIWVRVVPTNAAAIGCYAGAGFVRAAPEDEERSNRGQPTEYVWMRESHREP